MGKTKVEIHFDKVAGDYDFYKRKNSFYYDNLKRLLKSLIPANSKVLEVGCGTGELLDSLSPVRGYGMDISQEMIKVAVSKYKNKNSLQFSTRFPREKFKYIFMSDVIEHLENPGDIFNEIYKLMDNESHLIITMANPLWEPFLMIAEKLKFKMPEGPHTRLTTRNLELIIKNSKLKLIKHDYKLLIPVKIPFVTKFANKYLEKYLKPLCFIEYLVAVRS